MAQLKTKKSYETTYEEDEEIGRYLFQEIHYNKNGDVTKKIELNDKGQIISEEMNHYEGDRLTEVKNINAFEGIDQKSTFEYKDGLLSQMKEVYKNGDFVLVTYTYDDKGRVLEESQKDNDGNHLGRIENEYDDDERVTRETHYNASDEESYELETTEDVNGNLTEVIERHFKSPEDYTEKVETRTYTEEGKLSNLEITFETVLVFTLENIRDDHGFLIRQKKTDIKGGDEMETIFERNESGQLMKEEVYENEDLENTKEYVFDEFENLIAQKTFTRVNEEYFKAAGFTYELEYFED